MGLITSLIASIVTFVVSLLVGGLGIYVGAQLIAGRGDFEHAVWTALYAAVGVTLVSLAVGWVPFLGGLLATVLGLVVYLGVINWRYPGGWVNAAGIAIVAWLAATIVLALLRPFVAGVGAIGVL